MRLLALLAALAASPCFAQVGSVNLTCTPPTQYTDGTPIGTTAVSYKFYRGSTAGSQTTASPVQSSCAFVWSGLAAGTHYFSSTATVNGLESARSNVASKLIAGAAPNPPAIPQPVTIAGPVFNFAITSNALVRLEAGSVAAGVPCDPTQQIAYAGVSYMVLVDAARATAFPGQQILAAWARCQ